MKCPTCKASMSPLFTSWFCPNDCDKTPVAPSVGLAGLMFKYTFMYEEVKNRHRPPKKAWCSTNLVPDVGHPCPLCGDILMKLTPRPNGRTIAYCEGTDSLAASHVWEFWQ